MNGTPKNLQTLVFILVALLAGCSNPDRQLIVGQWQIAQVDALSKKVASEDSEAAREAAKMTIQFDHAGQLRTTTLIGSIDSTKTGSWKLLSYDKTNNTMKIECTLGMQTTEHEILFDGTDSIKWIPPNLAGTSQKIRFVRQ